MVDRSTVEYNQPVYRLARLLCTGLQGFDHHADSNCLPAHYTGTDSLKTNPNLALSAHCQLAHPAHPAALTSLHDPSTSAAMAATSVTNPLLSPSNVSALSEVGAPTAEAKKDEEAEGESGGRSRALSSASMAASTASPFSSRRHYLPSPAISPFSAHPSSAPSTKTAAPVPKVHQHGMASHPSSRFSVRAPLISGLLSASSLAFPYRIASSSIPFSPLTASVAGPQSQSVSVCASQPGPGGQRWPVKSKSLGSINERTIPAYQVSSHCHQPCLCTRVRSPPRFWVFPLQSSLGCRRAQCIF